MMRYNALLLLSLAACNAIPVQEKRIDLKKYYFPYKNMTEARIYKYVDKNDSSSLQYWWMQTTVIENDTILTTKGYDEEFKQIELFMEKIDAVGSSLFEFANIEDTVVSIATKMETDVYQWMQFGDKQLTWSVKYQSQFGVISMSKTRKLKGESRDKEFDGENYKTVKFRDEFSVSIKDDEGSDVFEYFQYSYYCEGLGLIEYERFLPNNKIVHYCLEEVLTDKEWEEYLNNK